MMHKPIQIIDLELSFPHKTCFAGFSCQIAHGSRIAIIGRNGSGKSSLLKMLSRESAVHGASGNINVPDDVVCGYVPQVIEDYDELSGGQRLNEAVTQALKVNPNVLLLDEPTNHLDRRNRKGLMRLLQNYPGTLIIVSHDTELLRNCIDTFWHIDNGQIHIFSGAYDDYMQERRNKRVSIEQEIYRLDRQKRDTHHALMKEQERAKKSDLRGEKSIRERKWPTIVSDEKARRAVETSGRKKAAISHRKQDLSEQLQELRLPEIITPKFSIVCRDTSGKALVHVYDGSVGYHPGEPILQGVNLYIGPQGRVAIIGDNGSGKSTLVKAIMGDPAIYKDGQWTMPKRQDIGYLDQHYLTLDPTLSVLETIAELVPQWSHAEVRCHLNAFLFRKNEEVNALVATLSGGEKARLTLAQIAARTPKLLILDEITNNLDLETKEHVVQVLQSYPGAMIVISHDEDFLREIKVEDEFVIR